MIEQKIEKGLCGYIYFQFYNTYHISFAALSRNKLKGVASGRNRSVAAPFVQQTSLLPFRPPYSVCATMNPSSSPTSQLWGGGLCTLCPSSQRFSSHIFGVTRSLLWFSELPTSPGCSTSIQNFHLPLTVLTSDFTNNFIILTLLSWVSWD